MQETRTYPVDTLRITQVPGGYRVVNEENEPICGQIFPSPEVLVEELMEALELPTKTAAYAALRDTMPGADQLFRVGSPVAIDHPGTMVNEFATVIKRYEGEYALDTETADMDRKRSRDAGIDFDALSRILEGANLRHVLFRSVRRAMAPDAPWTSARVAHATNAHSNLSKIAAQGVDPDVVVGALCSVSMCPLTLAGKLAASKRRKDAERARLESIRDSIQDLKRRIDCVIEG